jgi:hypothetical protein
MTSYEIPRDARHNGAIARLLEACGCDSYGYPEFQSATFIVRPYYWDDCSCGFEQRSSDWAPAHPHTAECYQTEYDQISKAYNWLSDRVRHYAALQSACERRGIPWKNGYGCAVHCDCGVETARQAWMAENDHAPDCPIILPNFHYLPTDYRLTWYKYPLRSAEANQDLTIQEFEAMMDACRASL